MQLLHATTKTGTRPGTLGLWPTSKSSIRSHPSPTGRQLKCLITSSTITSSRLSRASSSRSRCLQLVRCKTHSGCLPCGSVMVVGRALIAQSPRARSRYPLIHGLRSFHSCLLESTSPTPWSGNRFINYSSKSAKHIHRLWFSH